jgi:hypothetical protein
MSTANNTIQGNLSSLRPEFALAMWPASTGESILQCRPDALRNFEGVLIDRELHGAFEPERSGDQYADTAEGICRDPRFMGVLDMLPTSFHGGLDLFPSSRADAFRIEDCQRHVEPRL